MKETIISGLDARNAMISGLNKLANAVKVTLGPAGRTVILANMQIPVVTKDGVSVARAVTLPDPWENYAAQLIKNVAVRAEKSAGDGTTTATVLAQAMIQYGLELVESGQRPVNVIEKLTNFIEVVKPMVHSSSKQIERFEDLMEVATISSNGDTMMGKTVAKVVELVGHYGMVTVKPGISGTDTYEVNTGYVIPRGLANTVLNNTRKGFKSNETDVLLINDEIESIDEIDSLGKLILMRGTRKPLLIVCNDFDDTVVTRLASQVIKPNSLNVAMVRTPYAGKTQLDVLNDLTVVSDATQMDNQSISVITDQFQPNVTNNELQATITCKLGSINKLSIDEHNTTIDHSTDLSNYLNDLVEDLDTVREGYPKERLQERIGRLGGGVATIYCGGNSEAELTEREHRFDDAIRATQAASQYGTVRGGGYTLLDISFKLEEQFPLDLRSILQAPFKQILTNADFEEEAISEAIHTRSVGLNHGDNYESFTNVLSGELMSGGSYRVLDPYLVTVTALNTALSIAKLAISTDVMIGPSDKPLASFM